MAELYSNNAKSTLSSGIGTGDTTINIQSGHGALFPNPSGSDNRTLQPDAHGVDSRRRYCIHGDLLRIG